MNKLSTQIEVAGGAGEADSLCQLLAWDSEFFNCRIARVSGNMLNESRALQIDDWSRSHQIRCLYFLARADDPTTLQTAAKHGFGLMDIRMTLDCALNDAPRQGAAILSEGIRVRPFQADDLAGLQSIARTVHGDTRFFKDAHFPRQRAEDLYSTWITSDTQGRAQQVWVAVSEAGQPVGYISCYRDAARMQGQIGLVGVSPQARRRGIGKTLVLAAMDWFRSQDMDVVTVVTSGDNLGAQRLYQQCGFLSRDLELWHHKWYPIVD